MGNIVTTVDDLDTLLKGSGGVNVSAKGVNGHLSDIGGGADSVKRIYSTWDEPKRSTATPYLVALHTDAQAEMPDGQGVREWEHTFDFWYRGQKGGKESRRKNAAWTAQATVRTISPKRTQAQDLITDANRVEISGASMLWGREVDQRTELLIVRATIQVSEFL